MLEHAGLIIFRHVNGLRINQSPDGILTIYGGLARTLRTHFSKPLNIIDNNNGTFCIRREQSEELEQALRLTNDELTRRQKILEKGGLDRKFDECAAKFPRGATPAVAGIHRHADIAVVMPEAFSGAFVLGMPLPYPEYAREHGGTWEPGMKSWTFRLTDGDCVQWSFHSLLAAITGETQEKVLRCLEQGGRL